MSHISAVRREQPELFAPEPAWPAGFAYQAEIIGRIEEQVLAARIAELPLKPFEFGPYLGKRRVVSYGRRYDYSERALREAAPIPDFLLPLRGRSAALAGLEPEQLSQALVTEYAPGVQIGWHRDKSAFDEVVGVSLLSPCLLRMRRKAGDGWERASQRLEPRSAYLLSGEARTVWEHSIPPVDALRYSVTFRRLKHA
jgi:alkylated DNA repair dioxygenase AlkB